jgi:hypothetical protein
VSYLSVTNWAEYQHYRDRTPIWIKVHVETLHDEKLRTMPIPTRLLWDQMLLLAATFQNAVPNSPELIGELTAIPQEDCREGISILLKTRLLREKETRRSASKKTEAQKRREEEEKRNRARKKKAEHFVRNMADSLDDRELTDELKAIGCDELETRRLITLAQEIRSAA